MARRPRWIRSDTAYCETQRTVYPVTIHWLEFNINHKQSGVRPISDDREHLENHVRFHQLFNSLLAREVNRHVEREGPLFSTRNRSDVATDDFALEQQLLYAVTNPVKDGLVDRVAHWKGFSLYEQMATGEVETFTYLDRTAWHRAGKEKSRKARQAFTKTVTVELSPIPAWAGMAPHKRQALFRRRVREIEQACREERAREGRREMGPAKLAKLDHRDRPRTRKPRTRQPLCHSSSVAASRAFKSAWRSFLDRYCYASGMWMKGAWDVEFPAGSFRPPLLQLC